MKRSLVIGANSFIGQNLIKILKNVALVTGIYNLNTDNLFSDINNVPVSKLETLGQDFDEIYILSAAINKGNLDASSRLSLYKTNIEFVAKICTLFPNSKIIYCSSVSVYQPSDTPLTEAGCTGSLNEYGLSKYWGEKIVAQSNRFAIVRLSSVYGQGMSLNTILPLYIKQALTSKCITVWGNGLRQQNYIHVSDVAAYLMSAAQHAHNDTFLACSKESISNKQLAFAIAQVTGANVNFSGEDNSSSFIYDNTYTSTTLCYLPSVSIQEGIKQTIKWIENGL